MRKLQCRSCVTIKDKESFFQEFTLLPLHTDVYMDLLPMIFFMLILTALAGCSKVTQAQKRACYKCLCSL